MAQRQTVPLGFNPYMFTARDRAPVSLSPAEGAAVRARLTKQNKGYEPGAARKSDMNFLRAVGSAIKFKPGWMEGRRQSTNIEDRRGEAPSADAGDLTGVSNMVSGSGGDDTLRGALGSDTGLSSLSATMSARAPSSGGGARIARTADVDLSQVDPRLVEVVLAGAQHLPPGYNMVISEGHVGPKGGHVGHSQHKTETGALDVAIYDDQGNYIPNEGKDTTGMYQRLAQASYGEMLARYPDLKGQMNWGGAHTAGGKNPDADLMHFDLGGERGKLNPQFHLSQMGPLEGEEYGKVQIAGSDIPALSAKEGFRPPAHYSGEVGYSVAGGAPQAEPAAPEATSLPFQGPIMGGAPAESDFPTRAPTPAKLTRGVTPAGAASSADLDAMADMAYREARGEGPAGMRAVMQVAKNRQDAGANAKSYGPEVGAGRWAGQSLAQIASSTEFARGPVDRSSPEWKGARADAEKVAAGTAQNDIGNSLFFSNDKIADAGAVAQQREAAPNELRVGQHTFRATDAPADVQVAGTEAPGPVHPLTHGAEKAVAPAGPLPVVQGAAPAADARPIMYGFHGQETAAQRKTTDARMQAIAERNGYQYKSLDQDGNNTKGQVNEFASKMKPGDGVVAYSAGANAILGAVKDGRFDDAGISQIQAFGYNPAREINPADHPGIKFVQDKAHDDLVKASLMPAVTPKGPAAPTEAPAALPQGTPTPDDIAAQADQFTHALAIGDTETAKKILDTHVAAGTVDQLIKGVDAVAQTDPVKAQAALHNVHDDAGAPVPDHLDTPLRDAIKNNFQAGPVLGRDTRPQPTSAGFGPQSDGAPLMPAHFGPNLGNQGSYSKPNDLQQDPATYPERIVGSVGSGVGFSQPADAKLSADLGLSGPFSGQAAPYKAIGPSSEGAAALDPKYPVDVDPTSTEAPTSRSLHDDRMAAAAAVGRPIQGEAVRQRHAAAAGGDHPVVDAIKKGDLDTAREIAHADPAGAAAAIDGLDPATRDRVIASVVTGTQGGTPGKPPAAPAAPPAAPAPPAPAVAAPAPTADVPLPVARPEYPAAAPAAPGAPAVAPAKPAIAPEAQAALDNIAKGFARRNWDNLGQGYADLDKYLKTVAVPGIPGLLSAVTPAGQEKAKAAATSAATPIFMELAKRAAENPDVRSGMDAVLADHPNWIPGQYLAGTTQLRDGLKQVEDAQKNIKEGAPQVVENIKEAASSPEVKSVVSNVAGFFGLGGNKPAETPAATPVVATPPGGSDTAKVIPTSVTKPASIPSAPIAKSGPSLLSTPVPSFMSSPNVMHGDTGSLPHALAAPPTPQASPYVSGVHPSKDEPVASEDVAKPVSATGGIEPSSADKISYGLPPTGTDLLKEAGVGKQDVIGMGPEGGASLLQPGDAGYVTVDDLGPALANEPDKPAVKVVKTGRGDQKTAVFTGGSGGKSGGVFSNGLPASVFKSLGALDKAGIAHTRSSDLAGLAAKGFTLPNFSKGSGGSSMAYHPSTGGYTDVRGSFQATGTYVDSHGNEHSYDMG